MSAEVCRFLDMLQEPEFPLPSPIEHVEHEGRMVDPATGIDCGPVYVASFSSERRRFFSRYSRQSRFMTEVMARYEDNHLIVKILQVFDIVLENWKKKRHSLDRVYFLNVKCVLFLIAEHLNIIEPFPKSECLRDLRRFEKQKTLFKKFV